METKAQYRKLSKERLIDKCLADDVLIRQYRDSDNKAQRGLNELGQEIENLKSQVEDMIDREKRTDLMLLDVRKILSGESSVKSKVECLKDILGVDDYTHQQISSFDIPRVKRF